MSKAQNARGLHFFMPKTEGVVMSKAQNARGLHF